MSWKNSNDEEVNKRSRRNWVRKKSLNSGKDIRRNAEKENRGNYWKLLPSKEKGRKIEDNQLTASLGEREKKKKK